MREQLRLTDVLGGWTPAGDVPNEAAPPQDGPWPHAGAGRTGE
jgi:hypothetical protein